MSDEYGPHEVEAELSKYFTFILSGRTETSTEYIVEPLPGYSLEEAFSLFYDEVVPKGYYPLLTGSGDTYVLLLPNSPRRVKVRRKLAAALLGATIASVAITGYFSVQSYNEVIASLRNIGISIEGTNIWVGTLFFSLAVLLPIFLHEAGHFITAMRTKLPASFPLPIPAPLISPLGTFGAIIQLLYLPKHVKELAKLGISGPLVGTLLALALFGGAYALSPQVPEEQVAEAISRGLLIPISVAPLGSLLVSRLIPVELGSVVLMNPAAEAAYLILLIHFANLLPVGQLDGGHVFRALTSVKIHRYASIATALGGFAAAFLYPPLSWLGFFMLIAWFISGTRPHYGAANTLSKLDAGDRLKIGALYAFLLALTFPFPT